MLVDLISNMTLLVTLTAFYGSFLRMSKKNFMLFKVLSGLSFGFIAIAGMMNPFEYQPGAIFDGRSIVLTLAGLFGGTISTIISVILAGIYRVWIGGPGIWAGLATIVFCSLTGLFFRSKYKSLPQNIKPLNLLAIGVISHLVMLLCQLLFPWPSGLKIISDIWLPVILIFPITFLVIGNLLSLEERRLYSQKKIKEAENLFRATLYSIGDAVITTDKSETIQQMNPEAERLTEWTENEAKGKHFEEVYKIIFEDTRKKPESLANRVLKDGKKIEIEYNILLISRSGKEISILENGTPIVDKDGKTAGVVIIFRDQTQEKLKQKLIEESETKYREIIESIDTVSWEYDVKNDKWTYLAPQVKDKFGWLAEEWTDMEFWKKRIYQEDLDSTSVLVEYSIRTGNPASLEYRFKNKKGNILWVRNLIRAEKNNGSVSKLRGVMIDITKRKKMEIEMREKNQFIQTVLDSLPIGLALIKTNEAKATYMNRKFEEVYGWEASEIDSRDKFYKNVFPDQEYREKMIKIVSEDFYSGNIQKLHWEDLEVTRKDGSKAIVNVVNIPLFDQNIMVSTVIDITYLKEAQKLLKESEEQFRKLFENHSVIHLLIDPADGKIINANKAAANFYGYPVEELTNMRVSKINILSEEKIKEAMELARKRNKTSFEFQHRLANGEIRDVEVFSGLVELKKKDYLYSIVHDITEKKNLFKEIVKAKEKAEESDRLKSAFLANMSHEIRTPLNGILGFTGFLTEENDITPEKKKTYSNIINKSANNLMQIINDILDISRLETDQLILYTKNFNLFEFITNLEIIYQTKLEEKCTNLKLDVLYPPENIYINADESRLNQIFVNLLDNALKFTSEGYIRFGVADIKNDKISFMVSDTGIGIAPSKHEIIFNRFVQAEHKTSQTYGGTGLGLAIVKKLLDLMGGYIKVESEIGKGATFYFDLPHTIEEIVTEEKKTTEELHELTDRREVLLVEDDVNSIIFYKEILNNININLNVATCGKEALDICANKKFDVILMDIRLPDINGLNVVKEIRKYDSRVKIIAQSAFAMQTDEAEALEAGCNDYISKPVRPKNLLEKILGTSALLNPT